MEKAMAARSKRTPERVATMKRMAEEGASQPEVAEALGVNFTTVSLWWKDETGTPWPQARTGRKPSTRVEWSCDYCGKLEEVTSGAAERRRFCSRDCTNAWQREQVEWVEIECEGCNVSFEVHPSAQARDRKFCTKKCANAHQARRETDPANHVDLVCDNPACGKDFTRPRSLWLGEGSKSFCSNSCASTWTRTKRHYVLRDDDVVLDGAYEGLVWCTCVVRKIPIRRVERETEAITFDGGKIYAPDFFIDGTYVEVKGYEDDDDRARYVAWMKAHPGKALLVLRRDDLIEDRWLDQILIGPMPTVTKP